MCGCVGAVCVNEDGVKNQKLMEPFRRPRKVVDWCEESVSTTKTPTDPDWASLPSRRRQHSIHRRPIQPLLLTHQVVAMLKVQCTASVSHQWEDWDVRAKTIVDPVRRTSSHRVPPKKRRDHTVSTFEHPKWALHH